MTETEISKRARELSGAIKEPAKEAYPGQKAGWEAMVKMPAWKEFELFIKSEIEKASRIDDYMKHLVEGDKEFNASQALSSLRAGATRIKTFKKILEFARRKTGEDNGITETA